MQSYKELQDQIKRLQAEAEEARKNEIPQIIQDIKAKIAAYGITAKDLGFADSHSAEIVSKEKPLPKYRDSNGNEWSGRGRTPRWITSAIESGKSPDDFLIDK